MLHLNEILTDELCNGLQTKKISFLFQHLDIADGTAFNAQIHQRPKEISVGQFIRKFLI